MSAGLDDKRQGYSVDAALIALAQARDQIGVPDHRLRDDRTVEPELKGDSGSKMFATLKTSESVLRTHTAKPAEKATPGGLSMWGLIGLGALVPIGVVILGWQLLYRQTDAASVSTSSVSTALPAKSATPSQKSSQVAQQKDAAVASAGSPRLNLDQSVAEMARQVADFQQEIAELKTRQAQILLDNSELDRRLKEAQELAQSHADLINDLKSAQLRWLRITPIWQRKLRPARSRSPSSLHCSTPALKHRRPRSQARSRLARITTLPWWSRKSAPSCNNSRFNACEQPAKAARAQSAVATGQTAVRGSDRNPVGLCSSTVEACSRPVRGLSKASLFSLVALCLRIPKSRGGGDSC